MYLYPMYPTTFTNGYKVNVYLNNAHKIHVQISFDSPFTLYCCLSVHLLSVTRPLSKPLNDRAWLARSQIKAFHLIVSLWRRRLICDTERLKGFKLVIMTSLCAHSLWFCLRNWIELKDWIVHETVSWNFVMPSTTYSKWQSPHETFLHSVTFRQVFVNLLLKLWEAIWMVIVKYYSTSL